MASSCRKSGSPLIGPYWNKFCSSSFSCNNQHFPPCKLIVEHELVICPEHQRLFPDLVGFVLLKLLLFFHVVFCPFSFDEWHCIVCDSMYIIWLPFQTFLTPPSSKNLESHSGKCILVFDSPFQPISVIFKTFNLASSSIEVRHLSVNFLWLFDCCARNFTIHNVTVAYMCRLSMLVLSTESIHRDRLHVTTTP